jgi:hypothetical protein
METIFHFGKKEGLGYKSSLTPPLLIEMPVSSQEIEQSCICVLGVLILLHYTIWFLEMFRKWGILCLFISFIVLRRYCFFPLTICFFTVLDYEQLL